jgi:hypothetical protein
MTKKQCDVCDDEAECGIYFVCEVCAKDMRRHGNNYDWPKKST